ncbi:MAG: hypothetical protein HC838_13920 [Spirulinaceae cyanobacterium RM2_2_10]|nr:hypothetical protein [Spirulinaceae cyanobacterium SM2_1_0]NJO20910.1 hypothetical protein [Spirulinaceae cyanobacterium RM2_2_10]
MQRALPSAICHSFWTTVLLALLLSALNLRPVLARPAIATNPHPSNPWREMLLSANRANPTCSAPRACQTGGSE